MYDRYKLVVPFREIVRLYNLTNGVNLPATDRIVPPLSAKGLGRCSAQCLGDDAAAGPYRHSGASKTLWPKLSGWVRAQE